MIRIGRQFTSILPYIQISLDLLSYHSCKSFTIAFHHLPSILSTPPFPDLFLRNVRMLFLLFFGDSAALGAWCSEMREMRWVMRCCVGKESRWVRCWCERNREGLCWWVITWKGVCSDTWVPRCKAWPFKFNLLVIEIENRSNYYFNCLALIYI